MTWDRGWLATSAGHRVYYEQWGRQDGPVALVLHGGPGSGFSDRLRSFFDPAQFRVVAFDQRGCGRSTPQGECQANTTDDLLADIDALRQTLGIARWLVVGGSWGATLGLAYATRHRAAVTGLLLRGFFWPSHANIDHFFKDQPWRQWAAQLACGSEAAAQDWWRWEAAHSGGRQTALTALPALPVALLDDLRHRYRIQAHYLLHACWLNEAALGRGVLGWADVPIQFLHGSEDQVCPLARARQVHQWLAGSYWHTVTGAGHDPFHPAMDLAMRAALQRFGETGQFRVS